ncbi:MAG TPA: hypothetical protein VLV89_12395 [Candidatus Acidoferrum sp.]|nr:hypothetical protein [Candidatus Acidoferrum sp.]
MSDHDTTPPTKPNSDSDRKKAIPPPGIRCTFTDLAGRQCRNLALRPTGADASRTKSGFCLAHATEERQLHDAEAVADEVLGDAPTFKMAIGVNNILSKLFEMTINDRIPMRKAAILTYQASLILQSIGSVTKEFDFTFKENFRRDLIFETVKRIAGSAGTKSGSDSDSEADVEEDGEEEAINTEAEASAT